MRISRVETVYPLDTHAAVSRLPVDDSLVWLDSSNADASFGQPGRYSLIGWNPAAVLTQRCDAPAELRTRSGVLQTAPIAWELVRAALRTGGLVEDGPPANSLPPPGLVGYFGYELGEQLERLPHAGPDDLNMPQLWLAMLDHCVVLDHYERRAWVTSCDLSSFATPLDPNDTEQTWRSAVDSAAAADSRPSSNHHSAQVHYEQTADEYAVRVRRALEYIAAGDIYQVNLCQRITLRGLGDPLATHDVLRRSNPAPFAAFLRFGTNAVISTSPELFLQLSGRNVLTSPIKGTRPRTGDATHDDRARAELLDSEKDAAELAMIVDLHRNDLGRVCETGSVQVRSPRRLETHPRVFHTVADVGGQLRPDRDAIDLLAAAFPAGSVTGVPKIRAQQIIHELEPVPRGVFTGAIGHIGFDGSMTMNVAIRTLQIAGDRAVLHVGGGIVADSDPLDEYRETLAKARGILEAIRSSAPVHKSGND